MAFHDAQTPDDLPAEHQSIDEAPEPPAPARVWVLFHETNSGKFDESDGYVEGVFATEAAAEAVKLQLTRRAIAAGALVWFDPENPDDEGPGDWEHDWRIEQHAIEDDTTRAAVVDDLAGVYGWPAVEPEAQS